MRTIHLLLSFAVLPIFIACSSTVLKDQEAISMIRQAYGFPKPISVDISGFTGIPANSPLGLEINRLVREGYLIPGGYWEGHKPTEKGKDLVEKCVWNGIYKSWSVFRPFAYKKDVTRIIDKRVDKSNGTVVVECELTLTPTPYFEHLKKIDPGTIENALSGQSFQPVSRATATFQRWEKSWRIVR